MNSFERDMHFTGERFVPERSPERLQHDHLARYRFAARYAKDRNVLDIACGAGYSSPIFMESGASSYQGVDISRDAVRYASSCYGAANVQYETGDIRTFDPSIRYDLITCFETIEHVSFYSEALTNLARLLSDEGRLLISSPNRPVSSPKCKTLSDRPGNRFHTQEFTPAELLHELQKVGLCSADDIIYGQRLRTHYANRWIRMLHKKLFGNPNKLASPEVTPVLSKSPKYFVLVARHKETRKAAI